LNVCSVCLQHKTGVLFDRFLSFTILQSTLTQSLIALSFFLLLVALVAFAVALLYQSSATPFQKKYSELHGEQ